MSSTDNISVAAKVRAAAANLGDGETQIVLFAAPGGDAFDYRRVNPTKDIQNRFRKIASTWAAGLSQHTLVAYSAGRVPSEHELAVFPIKGSAAVEAATSPMENPIEIEVFSDPDFADDLRFYVVAAKVSNPGWLYFFKAKGETLRLKNTRKVALVPSGNAYDELEADPLIFESTFDAVVGDGLALVAKQPSFERALGFVQQASEAAQTTLTQLLATVTVKNGADLLTAAAIDINMISKLRSIAAKMNANSAYAASMTTEKLIKFAGERGIPIDTEEVNGTTQFVFFPDPQHRWRILKLLDDDYLDSSLTQLHYEVNSKSPI
ncbi:MAG TPA: Kiwa anti-phage protein KwaB-like domain-containing protein [Gaiellaceae bacterium]|nr:Kiwa anti-phage protein KwaB-like domain-containing protein [Gaiellaceae bacterium]